MEDCAGLHGFEERVDVVGRSDAALDVLGFTDNVGGDVDVKDGDVGGAGLEELLDDVVA